MPRRMKRIASLLSLVLCACAPDSAHDSESVVGIRPLHVEPFNPRPLPDEPFNPKPLPLHPDKSPRL